jgi:hypothetical protein
VCRCACVVGGGEGESVEGVAGRQGWGGRSEMGPDRERGRSERRQGGGADGGAYERVWTGQREESRRASCQEWRGESDRTGPDRIREGCPGRVQCTVHQQGHSAT